MKLPKFLSDVFNPAPDDMAAHAQLTPFEELEMKFSNARMAQAAGARRIAAFGRDYPELWQLYFTRAGESKRKRAANESA